MSKYHTASSHWDEHRARLRRKIGKFVPQSLIFYPFEIMVSIVALIMGVPFLVGLMAPATLIGLVGGFAFHLWAAALSIGGATILAGMALAPRPHPLVAAAGLSLTAGCFAVYSLAVIVALGSGGWTGFTVYLLLSLVAFIRASYFRRIVDIQKGATRLQEGGR